MASLPIRRTWWSWAGLPGAVVLQAPRDTVIGATNASANITITFERAMRAAPAASQFTATVGGVSRAVNSVSVTGAVLTIVLASAVATGNVVVITYAPSATPSQRLADTNGVEADAETYPSKTV